MGAAVETEPARKAEENGVIEAELQIALLHLGELHVEGLREHGCRMRGDGGSYPNAGEPGSHV